MMTKTFTSWCLTTVLVTVFFMRSLHPADASGEVTCKELLAAVADRSRAIRLKKEDMAKRFSASDPMGPLQTFLTGEVFRTRGEVSDALEAYQEVVEWAATDPHQDGRFGSGIAIIALARWLESLGLRGQGSAYAGSQHLEGTARMPLDKEFMRLVQLYDQIKDAPPVLGILSPPERGAFLSTLPQIQEAIPKQIAYLAMDLGKNALAGAYFLDYLQVARSPAPDPMGTRIMSENTGISREQADMLWAKRLYARKQYEKAFAIFKRLRQSKKRETRSDAGLHQAKIMRKRRDPRAEITALLGSVHDDAADPEIAQRALYERALENNRRGTGRNPEAFKSDMLLLVRTFPAGQLHDDALYQLAKHHENEGDSEQALAYYERLRAFEGENDRIDSAHFYPALRRYEEGGNLNTREAIELLKALMAKRPDGPMRFNALFWLGRICEETGKPEEARTYFRQIIADSPFHHFAVRARMHLNMGNRAKGHLWPDGKTRSELSDAFNNSLRDNQISPISDYHRRLKAALDSGLYQAALNAEQALVRQFPTERIEQMPLERLDMHMASLGLLLSLRQDAFSAKEVAPSSQNLFQIAGMIGEAAEDWPFVMTMVMLAGEYHQVGSAPQRDNRYLPTAYPPVFKSEIMRNSSLYNVRPEMLYSIMRRESRFSPTALSVVSAFGLFQFMPRTFQVLNERWNLLKRSGIRSMKAFLVDPGRSIRLGARWCREELLNRYKKYGERDVLFALMDHNAGSPAVRRWIRNWEKRGYDRDIEYMIETIGYGQTRIFTRRVLGDMFVSDAGGIF